jgi:hypothetical protein
LPLPQYGLQRRDTDLLSTRLETLRSIGMSENFECGGVLVPDGDGWRRTCFVEERGLGESLKDVMYADGKRPLQLTIDHVIPKSQGGENGPTHLAHLYCQAVQGGSIGGPIIAATFTSEHQSKACAARNKIHGNPATPESCAEAGRIGGKRRVELHGPVGTPESARLGGLASAAALTPEQRSERSRRGAKIKAALQTPEQRRRHGKFLAHCRHHRDKGVIKEGCEFCEAGN